jgi:pimeloyl-ACP methyl ester carboxylesterase
VNGLAASYAPELHLDGVVATAPSTGLAHDFWGAPGDSASPFTLMYVAGYHSAYGDLVSLSSLTDVGMSLYNGLGNECFDGLASAISPYQVDQVFTSTQLNFPLALLLLVNDPGFASSASTTPVLLVQGADDTTNPAWGTFLLAFHLCALGQDTVLWQYPGLGHDTIVGSSQDDVDHWIADRFAGNSNPDPYTPTGVDGVRRYACN